MSMDRVPAVEQEVSQSPAQAESDHAHPQQPVEDAPQSSAAPQPPEASAGGEEASPAPAQSAAAGETPAASPETATPPATASTEGTGDSPEESERKRRLRLNPTVAPGVARPIPNLNAAEVASEPPAQPQAAAASQGQTRAAGGEQAAQAPTAAAAQSATPPAGEQQASQRPAPRAPAPPPVEIPRDQDLDADMEAELAAALQVSESEPAVIAEGTNEEGETAPVTEETLQPGIKLKGTIQSIDAENVFIDFGLRMTGLVPLRQFDPKHPPQDGAAVELVVDKIDETEGLIVCHLPRGRARPTGDWSSVAVGQTVECQVASTNKGGLEVNVGALRGFMPASQVELGFAAALETYVGKTVSARITEVNPARRRLIVSRKLLLAEEREATEGQRYDELQAGQVHSGVVKTLKDYGAFIDLGGVDGFLHVGQISWQRINKPSDVLKEGQSVEVKILSVDREKKRISLSLRQMEQNPWAQAQTRYEKGTTVSGRVTRTEAFGAFVELEPGVEGLVHISELDHKRVARVEEVLKAGQTVDVQVLEVDPKRKRISLSVKALRAKPEAPKDEDLAPGKGEVHERKFKGPLKGGIGGTKKGGLFGDPRQFS